MRAPSTSLLLAATFGALAFVGLVTASACSAFGEGESDPGASSSSGASSTSSSSSGNVDTDGSTGPDGASAGSDGGSDVACRSRPFGAPTTVALPVLGSNIRAFRLAFPRVFVSLENESIVSYAINPNGDVANSSDLTTVLATVADKVQNHPFPMSDGSIFYQGKIGGAGINEIFFSARSPQGVYLTTNIAVLSAEAASGRYTAEEPWLVGENVMYFAGDAQANSADTEDIYRATRTGPGTSWVVEPKLTPISLATSSEGRPVVTADELVIFFASKRGSDPDFQVYMATRPSTAVPFSPPVLIPETGATRATPTWVSPDGCMLFYIASTTQVARISR